MVRQGSFPQLRRKPDRRWTTVDHPERRIVTTIVAPRCTFTFRRRLLRFSERAARVRRPRGVNHTSTRGRQRRPRALRPFATRFRPTPAHGVPTVVPRATGDRGTERIAAGRWGDGTRSEASGQQKPVRCRRSTTFSDLGPAMNETAGTPQVPPSASTEAPVGQPPARPQSKAPSRRARAADAH